MPIPASTVQAALKHLRSSDPVMKRVIREVGPFRLKLRRNRFATLVGSIISQQISRSAARSIRQKVEGIVAPEKITPDSIMRLTKAKLRSAGLSNQKVSYLRDLAEKSRRREIKLNQLGRLPDEQVIQQLTKVKGIGRWTAQMFLMFCLGRTDVFPHDDLGIRVAIRDLYQLDDLPDKQISRRIACPWRPFCTIASWYCWRSLDTQPIGSRSKQP